MLGRGLGGGRRFELLGEGPGVLLLWTAGVFFGVVVKKRVLPTSIYGYSWSVELQRNLMFYDYSDVIVRSESL